MRQFEHQITKEELKRLRLPPYHPVDYRAKPEDLEYLWRQPGTRTLAEKQLPWPPGHDDNYLRPQQVHVPLWTRLRLEALRRFLSLKDRILHPTVLMQRDRRPRWIDRRGQ